MALGTDSASNRAASESGFHEYSLTNCGMERRGMRAGGDFGVRPEAAGTIQSNGRRSRRVTRAYQPSLTLEKGP